MIEMALLVAAGLIVIWWRLSWKWKLRMLSHPTAIDVFVFIGLTALHWGTFAGVMVAAIAALAVSVSLSLGRWLFGYYLKGEFHQGRINIRSKLQ